MVSKISAEELNNLLQTEGRYGIVDVREKPEYERGQIFGASLIPRRLLEFKMSQLIPFRDTRVVVYDDDETRSLLAAKTLKKYGYTNVAYLEGGLNHWRDKGYFIVEGVNVPSKAFGELVASYEEVPQVEAIEVKKWMDNKENMVVFEVRPPEEVFKTGSIPGAINLPGMDLTQAVFDYIEEGQKIVTTCAGRTRGIMAVQILKLMGVEEVYDLKNGTMGWVLAGLELEKDIPMAAPPSPSSKARGEDIARKIAKKKGIKYISVDQLKEIRELRDKEILYQFDVRSLNEYSQGHIEGFVSLPGGQALQVTDEYIAVRQGKIVLVCDDVTRSTITAFWYMQMGFPEVYVLDGGIKAWVNSGGILEKGIPEILPLGLQEAKKKVNFINPVPLQEKLEEQEVQIINVDDSGTFEKGHIPGSHWISRSWLELRIEQVVSGKDIFLGVCSEDGNNAVYAAITLQNMGYRNVHVLAGGINGWRQRGLEIETGLTDIEFEPDDVFLKPYERKAKVKEAMVRYLTWEEKLLESPEYKQYFKNYQPFKTSN